MEGEQTPFVPDWRDEKAYTDHGDDLEAWAWEFLRRNPVYQQDFAIWQKLPDDDGDGNHSPKYSLQPSSDLDTAYCHCVPPAFPGETVEQFDRRNGHWPETWYSYISNRWKVIHPHDPEHASGPGFIVDDVPPYQIDFAPPIYDFGPRTDFGRKAMEHMAGRLLYAPWPEEIDSNVVVLGFDLRLTIKDQIAAAKKMLMELEKSAKTWAEDFGVSRDKIRRGTAQEDKRIALLQILDATLAGADDPEIIKELYQGLTKPTPIGGSQSARRAQGDEMDRFKERGEDWLKQVRRRATKMCESGYLKMVFWASLPISKK